MEECVRPEWARDLLPHIRLTDSQIERLEIIRAAIGAGHGDFSLHIQSHVECGKMLQRQQYKLLESEVPGLEPPMYLALLVLQRLATARVTGGDLFDLRRRFPDSTPDDDETLLAAIFEIVIGKSIDGPERLAEVISDYEDSLPLNFPPHPSTAEARRQITFVLAESNH
jgi:hypothetical protein